MLIDAATAYIGLGSNLDCPPRQMRRAIAFLERLPRSRLQAVSKFHRTQAIGPVGQPDYLNAVARIETRIAPLELLLRLQQQEARQGRKRSIRWGPRTIDLDILLYGELQIHRRGLRVPHYALTERRFVVAPLLEVAPSDLHIPAVGSLSGVASALRLGQD